MRHEKGRPAEAANPNNSVHGDGPQHRTGEVRHGGEPSLLDHLTELEAAEGQRRKAEGMARAQYGEDVRIVSAIESDVRRLAALPDEFIPCDVLPNLASRRSVGPVFSRLCKEGVIEIVGTTTSTRPERHGALTRVYRGTGGRS
jgi:hypothetical protein